MLISYARCLSQGKETHVHQAETRHHLLPLSDPPRGESARRTAGVDEELVLVLIRIEAMRAAPAQDVDVQLVGFGHHEVHLDGRHHGEALEEADSQRAMRHHLRQRQRRRLRVVPALDDLQVRRDRSQVVIRRLVRQVAQAQRLPNLAGCEEFLKLRCTGGG